MDIQNINEGFYYRIMDSEGAFYEIIKINETDVDVSAFYFEEISISTMEDNHCAITISYKRLEQLEEIPLTINIAEALDIKWERTKNDESHTQLTAFCNYNFFRLNFYRRSHTYYDAPLHEINEGKGQSTVEEDKIEIETQKGKKTINSLSELLTEFQENCGQLPQIKSGHRCYTK